MPLTPAEQKELDQLELQDLEEQEKASQPEAAPQGPAPFTRGSFLAAGKKSADAYQSPEGMNEMGGALALGLAGKGLASGLKHVAKKGAGTLADMLQGPSVSDKVKSKLVELLRGASQEAPIAVKQTKYDPFTKR